jgi:hypothetical protein
MKEQIANAVGELAAIPYFPADEYARRAIMRQIAKFVDRPDHLHWLVNAALNTMRHWDGIPELRGLYCTKFKPADGIEADCHLPGYSANDCEAQHALEAGKHAALPAAIMAELGSGPIVNPIDAPESAARAQSPKLDRTTADLRELQKKERLSLIAGANRKPIHIPATRKRTPEEHAAAVRELEVQLKGGTKDASSRKRRAGARK